MSKSEIEEQRLSKFVVMLTDVELSFSKWWSSLEPSEWMSDTLIINKHFVATNGQPNGQSADSSGPTHYFLPTFSTIQTPKQGISHYEDSLQNSVVGEFKCV